ncbi:MAG: hypothetical protein II604_08480 [Bacteroidales bacterium]|nr:hypothetical protein [Bacteroidales bacterium]
MINEPKVGELVYFLDGNKIVIGRIFTTYYDNEIIHVFSEKNGCEYLLQQRDLFSCGEELVEAMHDAIQELKNQRKIWKGDMDENN